MPSTCAHTHPYAHTHTLVRQRQKRFQQQLGEQQMPTLQRVDMQHPPVRAEGLCDICRRAVTHTHAQSPARSQTHLHNSPYLVPLHTQRFWSSSPALVHDALLRLKLFSSWKWKGCTGERRSRAKKGFLVIFCLGIFVFMIFFYYFFWQTRIPFELIHFFLPRISNDNA